MNATEKLVEAYFQHVGNCLTRSDVKVKGGVGRQFDLIAFQVRSAQAYHIEVDVTHELGWCRSTEQRFAYIERKFFGTPPMREGASSGKTDYEKGKNYFSAIKAQYRALGLRPSSVRRVLVSWVLFEDQHATYSKLRHRSQATGVSCDIHFLSFRNLILPALMQAVGKSNYENEMLRTLSLAVQREKQTIA